jgi:2-iminobutanoate/2-iminopropanoate deaminase
MCALGVGRLAIWWPVIALAGEGDPAGDGLRSVQCGTSEVRDNAEMAKELISTAAAPATPAAYSQAVKAGGFVFVSGQPPIDPATGALAGPTIQEQTAQCLRNVQAILTAAGSSLENVVAATFILADPDDFDGMNDEWARWFPVDPPARQGAKLPVSRPGLKISVAVTAVAS